MNPQYQPGDRVIVTPRGASPPFPAEVVKDIGTTLIEVRTRDGRMFPARTQVSLMALDQHESPAIQRAYVGIMQQRIERKGQSDETTRH